MDNKHSDQIDDTIRIRKPPRVVTDEQGRTIWMGDVEPSKLRLESTDTHNPYNTASESGWRASV